MPRNMTADELGIPLGTLVKVSRNGRFYSAVTTDGTDVTEKIEGYALKNAFRAGKALKLEETRKHATMWRQVSVVDFDKEVRSNVVQNTDDSSLRAEQHTPEGFDSHEDIVKFVAGAMSLKPRKLKIPEIWWKFAVRSVIRGKNLLVVGPSGCGKTLLAKSLQVALDRQFFYINLGATQDPRSTLIGNTHYSKDNGTFVALSYFANAIQVPNAIILLDEASRAHPEAHNILMTVLDASQRYLRVDEKADSETIKVAPGVSFILTANVGSEYTATRTMDRALLDRCIMFEMSPLDKESELENLREMYPDVEDSKLNSIAEVAIGSRREMKSESPKVDTIISTRLVEEWAGLIHDGLSLAEAAEVCVYPYFSEAGGAESPRAFMRALVQKYMDTQFNTKTSPNQNASGAKTPWDESP